ncbi:hypothetical protein INT45_007720 [Circinella minor]|uniref:Uncharacterized protein n=1 Tax=Circinella minor TaxID=1195481 RepID=A0A8H7RXA2_9FUNG|nr:hypothetical protein INT45_007720 [Circinella minor]
MSDRITHSSDLLNIPSRKKTLAKLLDVNDQKDNKNEDDISTVPIVEEAPGIPKEKPKMFKIDSSNDTKEIDLELLVLARVQSFLPQMQTANEQLRQQDPSKLDIENIHEEDQYIEMNLGLGVFEQKKKNGENEESESDSNDDDNDNDNDIVIPSVTNRQTKNEKPNIQLLSDSKED